MVFEKGVDAGLVVVGAGNTPNLSVERVVGVRSGRRVNGAA